MPVLPSQPPRTPFAGPLSQSGAAIRVTAMIVLVWGATLAWPVAARAVGEGLGPTAPVVSAAARVTKGGASTRIGAGARRWLADQALVLQAPVLAPAAVTVGVPTSVRVAAVVRVAGKPPQAVVLEELGAGSGRWQPVRGGELRDDGRDGDLFANDLIYARNLEVLGTAAGGTRQYRIAAVSGLAAAVSAARTLEVTQFPVGADASVREVIEDKAAGRTVVAGQVTASFHRGVSEDRIRAIVEKATALATGRSGWVIGYIPQLRLLQVALAEAAGGSEQARVTAVRTAVAELERHDEVRHARPNYVLELAQATPTPDGETSTECAGRGGQWAATRIRADAAWAMVGPLSGTRRVAVVDTGVAPGLDLCWEGPTGTHDPPGCAPVNVRGDSGDDGGPNGHGTRVASLVAALHGNGGISGIAHGLPVLSFDVGASLHNAMSGNAEIVAAGDTPEVGILNVSVATGFDQGFLDALTYVTCPTDVPNDLQCDCEVAASGWCKLVVAAAGNGGVEITSFAPVYPCAWPSLAAVLCVASTDASDRRAPTSNFGQSVDLVAPGEGVCTPDAGSGYVTSSGTSFAVPHVAGAAAVVWSVEPGLTALEVADRLKGTAEPIPDALFSQGKLGSGRLNLAAAVNRAPSAVSEGAGAVEGGGAVTGNVLANDDPGNPPAAVTAASQGATPITIGSGFATAHGGMLTLGSDGSYAYAPPAEGGIPTGGVTEVFYYTVTDVNGDSDSAALSISVADNARPQARAGPDRSAPYRTTVTLDGSASSDPEGQPLSFAWSLLARPAGSAASLSNPTSFAPSLVPDRVGAYEVQLVVSDGALASLPDTVVVTVPSAMSPACGAMLVGAACSTGLPCVSVRFYAGSATGAARASQVGEVLRAEGITLSGPHWAPLLTDIGSLACVGWRADLGGASPGAQCLASLLGAPFQTQASLPGACNFDGFPYEVVAP